MTRGRRWRVALAGYYGFGNLGDELLLRASLEMLDRCGVNREAVVVLSNSPADTSRSFDAASVSRWNFRGVQAVLRQSETLLLGGGGLFQDSSSLRSCLWYWGLVRLARLCGARPWAVGQSLGPFRTLRAQWLTRDALRLCRVLHLRDGPSMRWAERLGLKGAVQGCDPVLSLEIKSKEKKEEGTGGTLLLNLRPLRDPAAQDRTLNYILPALSSRIEAHRKAHGGAVIGTALSQEDEGLLLELREQERLGLDRVVLVRTPEEAAALWGNASLAIGMRLHFAILSSLFKVPLAVLSYDPKVAAFAQGAGVPCLDMDIKADAVLPRLPVSGGTLRDSLDVLCRLALSP